MIYIKGKAYRELSKDDFLPEETIVWFSPYKGCPSEFWKKGIVKFNSNEDYPLVCLVLSEDEEVLRTYKEQPSKLYGKRFLLVEQHEIYQ